MGSDRWKLMVLGVAGTVALFSCKPGEKDATRTEEPAQAAATENAGPSPVKDAATETAVTETEASPPAATETKTPPPVATGTKAPPPASSAATPEKEVQKAETPKEEAPVAEAPKATKGTYTIVAVPAPDKKTERLWKAKCASCHGAAGKADTEKGQQMKIADMTTAAWQTSRTNADLAKAINEGVNKEVGGVKKEMDAFQSDLSPGSVDALVNLVRWFGAPR